MSNLTYKERNKQKLLRIFGEHESLFQRIQLITDALKQSLAQRPERLIAKDVAKDPSLLYDFLKYENWMREDGRLRDLRKSYVEQIRMLQRILGRNVQCAKKDFGFKPMTPERYAEIDNEESKLTQDEKDSGYFFCNWCDGLLIDQAHCCDNRKECYHQFTETPIEIYGIQET